MRDFQGIQIDHYLILDPVGLGGMALVYKAYDLRLERDVAVKIIRTDEIPPSQLDRLMKRFEREAKAQSKFSHPNIVSVFDFGKYQDVPYLVLAYLPGGNLKERLTHAMLIDEALRILIQVSDAVAYAHSNGVLHRDIKPSNIIFDSDDTPLLADFGIAKVLEANEGTLTGTGLGVGTPEYMAPEQWQGKASESSDQYALGVLLYELVTGEKPYTAETPLAVALKQISEPLKQPREFVPDLPIPIENVIFKALAIRPDDRFESVKDLRDRLISLSEAFFPGKNILEINDQTGTLSPPLPQIVSQKPISEKVTIDHIDTPHEKLPPIVHKNRNLIKENVLPPSMVNLDEVSKEPSKTKQNAVVNTQKAIKEQNGQTRKNLKKTVSIFGSRYFLFPMIFVVLSFSVWGLSKNIFGLNSAVLTGTQQEVSTNAEEVVVINASQTAVNLPTETQMPTPTLTHTLTQTQTQTETPTFTATQMPTSTKTAVYFPPTATSAPIIVNTQPPPTATNPPAPTATNPPQPPTATFTPVSAPTREPTPTPP